MKLYSWNVNGIRAVLKKGTFQTFVQEHDPDILCLQETKAQKDQVEIDLPDYYEYWYSADKKGYSGTAIFSKTEPLNVRYGFSSDVIIADSYGEATREGRVITAEFADFFVVTAYTPNAKDKLARIELREKWDMAMISHCSELQRTKPVIYCGDMNVAHTPDDLARPKENEGKKGYSKQERDGFDAWLAAGFIDTFRLFTQGNGHYTWWTNWANARERNVGWRIDYFLVSKTLQNRVKSATIAADVMGSDHCPVSIELTK